MLDISKWNIDNIINKGDIFRETFSLKESSKIEKGLKQKEEKLLMDAYALKLFKSISKIVCQNKGSKMYWIFDKIKYKWKRIILFNERFIFNKKRSDRFKTINRCNFS